MTQLQSSNLLRLRERLKKQRAKIAELSVQRAQLEVQVSAAAGTSKRASEQLLEAAFDRDAAAIRRLISEGANLDARDSEGKSAVLRAVYTKNNMTVLRILIDAGADIDARDYEQNTALIACADTIAYVKALVEAGADVNVRNIDGDTPLTNAACWGAKKVVEYLLQHGAVPLLSDGVGLTPRDLAVRQGHNTIARLISSAITRAV